MYKALAASFGIILRRTPARFVLNEISFSQALVVYLLVVALGYAEGALTPQTSSQFDAWSQVGLPLVTGVAGLLISVFMSMWVLNRYAKKKFSLKEVFVLQTLFTCASSILFIIPWILGAALGDASMLVTSILSLGVLLYILLAFQKVISEIASVTKSQAAYVIVVPMFVFLAVYVAFLFLTGTFATVTG